MCSGMFQHVCLEQDNLGQKFEDAIDILRQHSMEDLQPSSDKDQKCYQPLHDHYPQIRGYSNCFGLPAISPTEEFGHNWRTVIDNAAVFEGNIYPSLQDITESTLTPPVLCQQKRGKGRKKLRLFEYLYESLCNPEMSSCIQWVDKNKGIFQFISKNKEKLAELWGKRKGNRKMMTYQKMARALRNYASTGEIIKIRRKLTYQFNDLILQRLSPPHILGKELFYSQCVQPDQKYLGSSHWDASYNYAYANHQDLHYPVC